MDEVLALGPASLVLASLAIFAGTMLQRLAGQGLGMLAAPSLALIAPQYMPATLLLIGAVVGLGSSAVDPRAIAKHELPPGFAGRALGAVIAAWIATHIADTGALAFVVAGVVYLGIALSLLGLRVAIRPASLFTAGTAAGVMGTLTAVGAPPMALLYQHEDRRRSTTMQNTFFAWGTLVSILTLAVAGLIGARHVAFALVLLPSSVLALWLSHRLAQRVEKARIRPWALGLAGTAATILLARQLVGV